jgi:hypothetical protein
VLPAQKGGCFGEIQLAALVGVDLDDETLVGRASVSVEHLSVTRVSECDGSRITIVGAKWIEFLGEFAAAFSDLLQVLLQTGCGGLLLVFWGEEEEGE